MRCVFLFTVVAVLVIAPLSWFDGGGGATLCPSTWLGGSCPTCGFTRALRFIILGRWGEAWGMNPAAFPFAAGMLLVAFTGKRKKSVDFTIIALFFVLGLLSWRL
jgi:hypothetical protein